jgi:DNA-binding transcriptional regulator/RsmH inhibitor MraZ
MKLTSNFRKMLHNEQVLRSILHHLSLVPVDYWQQVDAYLQKFARKAKVKRQQNRSEILALAGTWKDMSDEDFDDFLRIAKTSGNEMFNRDVEL